MTTRDVNSLYSGIAEMLSKEFPAKVAFALSRNFRKLQPIVEDYQKARVQIIVEHGGHPAEDNPSVYVIDAQDPVLYAQINQEIEDLESIDNEDVQLTKIKLSDLNNLNLSIEAMNALYPMISEED